MGRFREFVSARGFSQKLTAEAVSLLRDIAQDNKQPWAKRSQALEYAVDLALKLEDPNLRQATLDPLSAFVIRSAGGDAADRDLTTRVFIFLFQVADPERLPTIESWITTLLQRSPEAAQAVLRARIVYAKGQSFSTIINKKSRRVGSVEFEHQYATDNEPPLDAAILAQLEVDIKRINPWLPAENTIEKVIIVKGLANAFALEGRTFAMGTKMINDHDNPQIIAHESGHNVFASLKNSRPILPMVWEAWVQQLNWGKRRTDATKKVSPFELITDSNYFSIALGRAMATQTFANAGHPDGSANESYASVFSAYTMLPMVFAGYIDHALDWPARWLGIFAWAFFRDHLFDGKGPKLNGSDPFADYWSTDPLNILGDTLFTPARQPTKNRPRLVAA